MKKYKAGDRMNYTVTEGNYLRFGLQSVKDGVIFTFAGEKEDVCAVILYDRSLKVAGRVEAPAAFCRGAVRSVYIHGLKADHLLYNYEINSISYINKAFINIIISYKTAIKLGQIIFP